MDVRSKLPLISVGELQRSLVVSRLGGPIVADWNDIAAGTDPPTSYRPMQDDRQGGFRPKDWWDKITAANLTWWMVYLRFHPTIAITATLEGVINHTFRN